MLPRPTAIFACNDLMAFGVLQAARELNLRCPEDLSIAGFDSLEFTKFTDPSLTSVYQPGYQLGATAARLLLQRVDGMRFAPKKLLLPTELKKRNSVGPPFTLVAQQTERTLNGTSNARERNGLRRRKNRA
jgi:LacI family transcriptional regulator